MWVVTTRLIQKQLMHATVHFLVLSMIMHEICMFFWFLYWVVALSSGRQIMFLRFLAKIFFIASDVCCVVLTIAVASRGPSNPHQSLPIAAAA